MIRIILMTAAIFLIAGFTVENKNTGGVENPWNAPPEANRLINPLKGIASATAEGKKVYMQLCVVCHGDKGKGDGVAGIALTPRPGNFTSQKVQAQTDGALFWKMTEGRPPMARYKDILTETQRWQLVNHLRTFYTLKK